jgi:hypothetical protein
MPVVDATPLATLMIAAETAGQCRVIGFGSGARWGTPDLSRGRGSDGDVPDQRHGPDD